MNLSSKPLTQEEREVLSLGLKFAPTPRRTPDPLEFYEKYHQQCLRVYNKLIHTPGARNLPSLVEEHLSVIRERETTKHATTQPGRGPNQMAQHVHCPQENSLRPYRRQIKNYQAGGQGLLHSSPGHQGLHRARPGLPL